MNYTPDDELLPKRAPTSKLEDESIDRLTSIFPTDQYILRQEKVSDAGIDLTIEMAQDYYTNRRVNVQMKSTTRADFNVDGSISKSIERKNLIYIKSSALLGLYIYYISETQTFYYEWVHEFENHLTLTVPDWRSQKTNTLRFSKVLNAAVVKEIFKRVELHAIYLEQLRSGLKVEQIIGSFHEPKEDRNYTDIEWSLLNLIKIFDGLVVLPSHILIKLPPFSLSTTSSSYYNSFDRTFYTDNLQLIRFFSDLKLESNTIIRINNSNSLNQENLKKILTFLEYNSIYHIAPVLHEIRDQRVCVHNLFYSNGCTCERCSYPRLEWDTVIDKINANFNKDNTYEWLRRGYVLLELGKIKEAYNLYKGLAETCKDQKKHVSYIIAKFNMVSMLFLVRNRYLKEDSSELENEINSIDLRNEIHNLILITDVKREVLLILLWLVEGDYFHQLYVEVDIRYQKILSDLFVDQRGGVVTQQNYLELREVVSEMSVFSEGNAFHSQYFNGFRIAVHKLIEATLILYGLKNPLSAKPSGFDNYLVRLCILYGDPDKLNKLLFRHNVYPLSFPSGHENDNGVLRYIDNLIASLDKATPFCSTESINDNHVAKERLNEHLQIAGTLVSIMDVDERNLNRIALNFIRSSYRNEHIESGIFNGLRQIFLRKRKTINLDTYFECYKWMMTSRRHDNFLLTIEIPYFINEGNPGFIDNDPEVQASVLKRIEEFSNIRSNHHVILCYWKIATVEFRDKIKHFVNQSLEKRFDSYLYYISALESVIDYQKYLEKFLSEIPIKDTAKNARRSFKGYDDYRNDNLNKFIQLSYRFQIDLNNDRLQELHEHIPYYKWLMNLKTFNYSEFDPYWVLFQSADDFLNEFKRYPQIKLAVKHALEKNPNSRLTEIYVKYLND